MTMTSFLFGLLLGLIFGGGGLFFATQVLANNTLTRAKEEAERLKANVVNEAQNKAKEIELSAQPGAAQAQGAVRAGERVGPPSSKSHEPASSKREDTLDRKLDTLSVKEKHLDDLESRLAAAREGAGDQGGAARPRSSASSATGCCRSAGLSADAGQGDAAPPDRGRVPATRAGR